MWPWVQASWEGWEAPQSEAEISLPASCSGFPCHLIVMTIPEASNTTLILR